MKPTGTLLRTVRLSGTRAGESRAPDDPIDVTQRVVAGIQIEKDVPMPTPRGHQTPAIQALLALKVGESFSYSANVKSAVHSKTVRATGRKFTVRQLDSKTSRVWRVS